MNATFHPFLKPKLLRILVPDLAVSAPQGVPVVRASELARAEAVLVRLKLPYVARWRRGVRYVYTPGFLSALQPRLLRLL